MIAHLKTQSDPFKVPASTGTGVQRGPSTASNGSRCPLTDVVDRGGDVPDKSIVPSGRRVDPKGDPEGGDGQMLLMRKN
ncbi:hypothetical protein GWI33_015276 [Rhynchophorus ferrugineus]|uniref:Uncharacterized protein n=1 Tax=Rhynchophorus ferrugineus TaxID=354439 RepID=A0A834I040_RHYFE|nr:hypothetical protein GWI33_015276 [Rhynchophorus ferrugineus]